MESKGTRLSPLGCLEIEEGHTQPEGDYMKTSHGYSGAKLALPCSLISLSTRDLVSRLCTS